MWGQRLGQLTEAQRTVIILRRAEGMSIESLAKRFGVSNATIWRVLNNRRQQLNVKTVKEEITA